MNVGFIGLGGMGREMARRLLAAGHSVQVWNRSPAPVETLVPKGATPAVSVAEALSNKGPAPAGRSSGRACRPGPAGTPTPPSARG